MKKALWIIVLLCVVLGVVGYVGAKYFNNFNNFSASPNCQHDCYEDGVRVR